MSNADRIVLDTLGRLLAHVAVALIEGAAFTADLDRVVTVELALERARLRRGA